MMSDLSKTSIGPLKGCYVIVYGETMIQYCLNGIIFQLFITQQSRWQHADTEFGQTAGCYTENTKFSIHHWHEMK